MITISDISPLRYLYGYDGEAIGADRKEEWKAIILAKKEQLVNTQ